jgi:glycosyltransferase involved in cell wall biosynthesis
MRIEFVDIEDPEDVTTWSGIPYFILRELRRRGVEVEVIAPLKRSFKYLFTLHKFISKLTRSSVQINRRPIALRSFAAQVERRIRGKKFDAIFSTSSIPISYLKSGTTVLYWTDAVTEAMEDYYAGSFANMSARELRIAHNQEQAALDRASFAVYASSWAAGAVDKSYKTSSDKVQVIEFGANLPTEHDLSDIAAFNKQRLQSQCVLLFIGVDWERKGGAVAFEAAELLNKQGIKTVLRVVGGKGPDSPFVENLGFINKNTSEGQSQIKKLLTTSTFFILPTRAEAAGIVFCEAAAFGLPTLATRTGGVQTYVLDSVTGYCLPVEADGRAYADRIAASLGSAETYCQLSINAFNRYKQALNWEVGVSSLLRLVERANQN